MLGSMCTPPSLVIYCIQCKITNVNEQRFLLRARRCFLYSVKILIDYTKLNRINGGSPSH